MECGLGGCRPHHRLINPAGRIHDRLLLPGSSAAAAGSASRDSEMPSGNLFSVHLGKGAVKILSA